MGFAQDLSRGCHNHDILRLPPTSIVTTPLEGPLKREIIVGGAPYTVTITPSGMSLVLKGRRKGFEMQWQDVVSGEAALATALNASLTARLGLSSAGEGTDKSRRRK